MAKASIFAEKWTYCRNLAQSQVCARARKQKPGHSARAIWFPYFAQLGITPLCQLSWILK